MQPKIHLFDGEPFVATPYRAGTYIRQDVFWRQFKVACEGRVEYPEDDPQYGTYWSEGTLYVGRCGLIEDAMALCMRFLSRDRFSFGEDSDALDFAPQLFLIRDRSKRLVLAGEARDRDIRWSLPAASASEEAQVIQGVRELRSEASYESGMCDNYETARRLRLKAEVLQSRLVHPFWRPHARKAVLSAAAA